MPNVEEPWPVIGPRHNDKPNGFDTFHYHLDERFLTWRQEAACRAVAQDLLPHHRQFYYPGATWFDLVVGSIQLVEWDGTVLPEPRLEYRVCVRSSYRCSFDMSPARFEHLRNCGDTAWLDKGRLSCPHLGVDFSTCPIEDGTVQCPLHGLNLKVPEAQSRSAK